MTERPPLDRLQFQQMHTIILPLLQHAELLLLTQLPVELLAAYAAAGSVLFTTYVRHVNHA